MSVMNLVREEASVEMHSYVPQEATAVPSKERPARTLSLPHVRYRVSVLPPLMLGLFLLGGWYISTVYGHVSSLLLPAPGDVWTSLADGLSSGLFVSNAWVTIQESLLGFIMAFVLSLPLAYGLAKSRLFASLVLPYFVAGQAIPAIVIAPLLILWLGYGLVSNMVVCMLVVLFPMVITIVLGIKTMEKDLVDAARVEGASGWALLSAIEFPLALPAILSAIRTGLTLSVIGALVAEFVSSGDQGLGALMQIARNQFDMPMMFATLIVLAVLALIYYGISWLLTRIANAVY